MARSTSAFSATTDNSGNSLSTQTVTLSDNDNGAAMFTATALAPGPITATPQCVAVTYTGSTVGATKLDPIKLYATPASTPPGPYLDLTIERSAINSTCGFFGTSTVLFSSGTLESFSNTRNSLANGLSTGWTPATTGERVAFRFTMALKDDNAAQGKSSNGDFVWKAQSR